MTDGSQLEDLANCLSDWRITSVRSFVFYLFVPCLLLHLCDRDAVAGLKVASLSRRSFVPLSAGGLVFQLSRMRGRSSFRR